MDPDWYFVRAASIARKIYLNSGLGVGALARWYGDAYKSSNRPEHFRRAARGLIRHILINLEKAGIVEQTEKGCVACRSSFSLITRLASRPDARPSHPPPRFPRSLRPPSSPSRSGRRMTSEGLKELDTIARNVASAE
jgi:small subunit ribosomal protein S19e